MGLQGCIPSGSSRGEPFSYLFQLLECAHLPRLLASAPTVASPLPSCLPLSCISILVMTPAWIIQNTLPVSRSLITTAKSCLPWEVTRSQVWGMQMWRSLRSLLSVYCTRLFNEWGSGRLSGSESPRRPLTFTVHPEAQTAILYEHMCFILGVVILLMVATTFDP